MRLTKEMRETILKNAMSKAFDARDKAHEKATTGLADAVYAHTYGEAEKIARKLPQGFCRASDIIEIDAAGFGWRNNGLKSNCLRMSKLRPIPNMADDIKIGGAHPLNDQAQAVAEEYQAIKRDKEALRAKLNAIVWAVNTTPKLLEAWPECEQFLPANAPRPTTALVPVDLVPQVNAALGIKPKTKGS